VKLVRDLSFAFRIPEYDEPIEARTIAQRVVIHPAFKTIIYSHATFTVRAHVFAPLEEPGALILLDVESVRPLEVLVRMHADFNLQWPGGFGGQNISWNAARRGFQLVQGGVGTISGVVMSPAATAGTQHAAHDAPAFGSQFRMAIDTALARTHFLPVVIAGGIMRRDSSWAIAERLVTNAKRLIEEKAAYYEKVRTSQVSIVTPDAALNSAFEWAKVGLDRQRVCNPDLGCGLVAGYGKAGAGNFRPGFGWYFGGDAAINSFAMDALGGGQFDLVREGLTFLGNFQRADGKIPHELSHSAKRLALSWFTDYPYTWYHGDTTPFWILAAVEYWRASGDKDWIDATWPKLRLAYDWSRRTDSDSDGLMENPLAGAGAIEVGNLQDALHTDIYLAGVWVSALEGLRDLALARRDTALAGEIAALHTRARRSLEERFWMAPMSRYAFAILKDSLGRPVLNDALTAWPSTAIAFGQMDGERASRMMAQVAGASMTTDWGVRTLDQRHRFYDPLHYNNGAVWPFVTGFASWAHYRARRGWAGYDLLRDVAQTGSDFALGVQPELMSGAFYRPLDTAMPDQFFSTSMIVSPLVRGMLGWRAEAAGCRVWLSPQLPAQWDSIHVQRLPAGCGTLDVTVRRSAGALRLALRQNATLGGRTGSSIEVTLSPSLPLGASVSGVTAAGQNVRYELRRTAHDVSPEFTVSVRGNAGIELQVRYHGGAELVPADVRAQPGDPVKGPRLVDWRQENGTFVATVEGMGTQTFQVRSEAALRAESGGRITERRGTFNTIEVDFGSRSESRKVVLRE
jgi:glycogen debranching enzyme